MSKISDHGYSISVATIATWVPLVPLLWFVGKPIIVASVSEAMAEDVQQTVQHEVEPINNAFTVLLTRDINKIRREIAALKFRQRQNGGEDWTSDDAEYLADLEIEMDALKDAKDELKRDNTT